MSEEYEITTPTTTAIISKTRICVKGSPEVCHLITEEMQKVLTESAMHRGWKVKRVK